MPFYQNILGTREQELRDTGQSEFNLLDISAYVSFNPYPTNVENRVSS